jgi:hypothetical protein
MRALPLLAILAVSAAALQAEDVRYFRQITVTNRSSVTFTLEAGRHIFNPAKLPVPSDAKVSMAPNVTESRPNSTITTTLSVQYTGSFTTAKVYPCLVVKQSQDRIAYLAIPDGANGAPLLYYSDPKPACRFTWTQGTLVIENP